MGPSAEWIQEHLLSITTAALTLVLFYHYLVEKGSMTRLSKRYRDSILEAQSKIFLNATQYLIAGDRDLAIREFLNAVDLNKETIETYFALGRLLRSNGEIEKAISIHRSLVAKENVSEDVRLRALKDLALDFEKGGFLDKAVETYKDALRMSRDQPDVLRSLCSIHEDIQDWDGAYAYRTALSGVSHENQSETISHILVERAKRHLRRGNPAKCDEDLEEAFRFAPSVSARILKLKLLLLDGAMEEAKIDLVELLREHPMYASFVFESLSEAPPGRKSQREPYRKRVGILKDHFMGLDGDDLLDSQSVALSKVRLLKDNLCYEEAADILRRWMREHPGSSEVMRKEYIRFLIDLGKKDEALAMTRDLLDNLNQSVTKHFCSQCGYGSDDIFWRCPQCRQWETIEFRWKV